MSTWYSLNLGDGVAAYRPTELIMNAFTPFFISAGLPHDMTVFSKYDHEKNIVTAYFSPSSEKIAKMFNAKPCEKPSFQGIRFMVGDVRGLHIHFPELSLK